MVRGRRAAHLVPADVTREVLVEGRQLAVSPVFVQQVELQQIALQFDIVQRGHRVGVVARAADHPAQFVAGLLDDEELLRGADAEAEPDADDVLLGERRLPRTRHDVAASAATAASTATGRNIRATRRRRAARRDRGDDDVERIRTTGIFDHRVLELAAAAFAACAADFQRAVLELRCGVVRERRAAVRLHVHDLERQAVRSQRAVDKRQCRRIRAVRAVDAADLGAANRKLERVRLSAVGSPAAAIVVRIFCERHRREPEHGREHDQSLHGGSVSYDYG